MCGIIGIFEIGNGDADLRSQVLEQSRKIRHRGPDWSGIYEGKNAILAHERLAIVDPQSGRQPLFYIKIRKTFRFRYSQIGIFNKQILKSTFCDTETGHTFGITNICL